MVDSTRATESEWVNVDLVRQKQPLKAIITDGGKYEEGKYGEQLVIGLEVNKKAKKYSPNRDSAANMKNMYGAETNAWVGYIIELSITRSNGKEIVIAVPTREKLTE